MPEDKKTNVSQYNIEGKALEAFLGPLEASIMETVWSSKKQPISVRETYETLKKHKKVAYTTVMTIMDRLHAKHLLCRQTKKSRGGVCYVYWPAFEKQNFQKSAVREVLSSLISNFGEVVANYIIEETDLSEEDRKIIMEHLHKKQDEQGAGR